MIASIILVLIPNILIKYLDALLEYQFDEYEEKEILIIFIYDAYNFKQDNAYSKDTHG